MKLVLTISKGKSKNLTKYSNVIEEKKGKTEKTNLLLWVKSYLPKIYMLKFVLAH